MSRQIPRRFANGSATIGAGLVFALALIFATFAYSQQQKLPGELKGRWVYQNRASQAFAFEEMRYVDDTTVSAKLTWWLLRKECVVREQLVNGKVETAAIVFEFSDGCGQRFRVAFNRDAGAWGGKARVDQGSGSVDLDIRLD